MKVNTVTRTVRVTVDNATLLNLFVNAIYGDANAATGKQQTFYRALSSLVGISDVDAVKRANRDAKKWDRITVAEFRCWLPTVFAEFARAMLEINDKDD